MKYRLYDDTLKGAMPVQLQSTTRYMPMTNPELWTKLEKAKTKQEKLGACYEWISGQGGFGNCEKDRLAKIRQILY